MRISSHCLNPEEDRRDAETSGRKGKVDKDVHTETRGWKLWG